jgi:rhodanese-related sulfurtransferase
VSSRIPIKDRLARARERIDRFTPAEAKAGAEQGAVIVDTRCTEDRHREGQIPGAIEVPLSVLEWRCDPDSNYADDRFSDLDLQIIVMCNDGFSSSLAASSLRDLGFGQAGDIVGGFRAWVNAGLPVIPT